jgi:hypothetical protein
VLALRQAHPGEGEEGGEGARCAHNATKKSGFSLCVNAKSAEKPKRQAHREREAERRLRVQMPE